MQERESVCERARERVRKGKRKRERESNKGKERLREIKVVQQYLKYLTYKDFTYNIYKT